MDKLAWRVAGVTDRGLSRRDNQDNYYVSADERLFVVADGMGGVKGGAEASRLAVAAVESLWKEKPPKLSDHALIQDWLQEAVENANEAVCQAADAIAAEARMGTTIVVVVQSDEDRAHIAHVGDSRAYLMKDGEINTLTHDHSVVYEMMRKEKLTLEQCWVSPFRNLLTRCLGHDREVVIDKTEVELSEGAWIVLCTDGLCGVLRDEQITSVMTECKTAEEVCSKLVASTIEAGAPDNVTIIAVQYGPDSVDGAKVTEPACATAEEAGAERSS